MKGWCVLISKTGYRSYFICLSLCALYLLLLDTVFGVSWKITTSTQLKYFVLFLATLCLTPLPSSHTSTFEIRRGDPEAAAADICGILRYPRMEMTTHISLVPFITDVMLNCLISDQLIPHAPILILNVLLFCPLCQRLVSQAHT